MNASVLPPFGIFATIGIFALGVVWLFLVGTVIHDAFTAPDLGGGSRALWLITVLALPLVGVVGYLAVRGGSMQRRDGDELARRRPAGTHDRAPASLVPLEGGR